MMGFLDKVKDVFGSSEKEDIQSQDSEANIFKHDVFISFSSIDNDIAFKVCYLLELNGLKCWISHRDIILGNNFQETIKAVESAKIVVMILSKSYQKADYLKNEIYAAFSNKKPIIAFKIEDFPIEGNLEQILKNNHVIEAFPNPEEHFPTLIKDSLYSCSNTELKVKPNKNLNEKSQGTGEAIANVFNKFKSNNDRNFKYLDKLIHSGKKEIILDSDIILSESEHLQYYGGINLDMDDLIIDGNGFCVDACGKTRIFYCSGKNIVIKNIILKNGFASEHIGARYLIQEYGGRDTPHANINNPYGGAIFNVGKLNIIKSSFTNNLAVRGGAIYNNGGKLCIFESIMNENTTKGEAIDLEGSTVYNDRGVLSISHSTLNNNTSKGFKAKNASAVCNYDGELTIAHSTLNNNMSEKADATIYNWGSLKMFSCEISYNESFNSIILNRGLLNIYNTNLNNNRSDYIILNEFREIGSNLGIFYGKFIENKANESILCNTGKSCSVDGTIFENNLSTNSINISNKSELNLISPEIKDEGKTILNEDYILIRKSSPNLEDKIFGDGTVEIVEEFPKEEQFNFGYLDKKIHESDNKEIILNHDIIFENYERDYYEGGIELDIDNLVIDGNGKTIDGSDKTRIFLITGKNIVLKNIIFKNGHSHKNHDNPFNSFGGAIKINHNVNLTIENCEFINNMSEGKGGAIYNNGDKLSIFESEFNNNDRVIYNNGGELSIFESEFKNNDGAIYNYKGELIIKNCILCKNHATYYGGIYNNKGSVSIFDSILRSNNTIWSGGAIFNNGTLSILSSTLAENTARRFGGAIFLTKSSKYESQNCTFNDNDPDDVYEEKD